MFPTSNRHRAALRTLALAGACAAVLAGCSVDEILQVDAPDILTTDELQGPGGIEAQVNGIVGAFNEQFDNYVRYSGLLTDEFIAAGTFPTRIEVDDRRIFTDNATVTAEVAEVMHRARLMADTSTVIFSSVLADPAFADVVDRLNEGIALGQFYGGYIRILLAELYCETPVANGPVQSSDELMQSAIDLLEQAETGAAAVGRADLVAAARVGQARALMWLGDYDGARSIASEGIPDGFEYLAEYSDNTPEQENEVYDLTWGRNGAVIRWTVGDGMEPSRHNERWPYYDEWVELGMIIPDANGKGIVDDPFSSAVDLTNLQMKYDAPDSAIVLASKAEADMILAEIAVRNEDFVTAN
ncbi:MAG TPA: hypothetical protein VF188_04330, partial [Longimicrobiales bacterium]